MEAVVGAAANTVESSLFQQLLRSASWLPFIPAFVSSRTAEAKPSCGHNYPSGSAVQRPDPNAWDPYDEDVADMYLDAEGLIKSKGYPFEEHTVETEDGYILKIHRIPHGREYDIEMQRKGQHKPAVFIQHGFWACSEHFIMNLAPESLGFVLADAGYDVWLGNCRGNKYSKRHRTISPYSPQFWQFSFHEMAEFDVPAMVEFVCAKTRQEKIFYIGHSLGTLVALLRFSEHPEWAEKHIKQLHGLAPAAHLKHIKSPMRLLTPLTLALAALGRVSGRHEFVGSTALVKWFEETANTKTTFHYAWWAFLRSLTGNDERNLRRSRLPVYAAHTPSGTSIQNVLHMAQMVKANRLQAYDYGYLGNWRQYGSFWPPEYNVRRITIPTVIYSGDLDSLADPADVELLANDIGHVLLAHHKFADTQHFDFIWGQQAPAEIYPKLLKELEKHESKSAADANSN